MKNLQLTIPQHGINGVQKWASVSNIMFFPLHHEVNLTKTGYGRATLWYFPVPSLPPAQLSFGSCMRLNLFHMFNWQLYISEKILLSFVTCHLFYMTSDS